ncbi:MAG TPA: hypothetical protein VN176_02475, partial [Verrucomicrobiae bacterium]|nr:hypothetical protein [Verrucomicrobiae bacterium]
LQRFCVRPADGAVPRFSALLRASTQRLARSWQLAFFDSPAVSIASVRFSFSSGTATSWGVIKSPALSVF